MAVNLILLNNGIQGRILTLRAATTIVGRRHDCDLQIPAVSVSRKHCEFNLQGDTLTIRDLGSRNGTFLNGKPVKQATINAGDCLKIGPVQLLCRIDGTSAKAEKPSSPPPKQAAENKPPKAETKDPLKEESDNGSDAVDDLNVDDLEKFLGDAGSDTPSSDEIK